MQPVEEERGFRVDLTSETLLALYVDEARGNRSVLVGRERGGGAVALIEALEFTLYLATQSEEELDAETLREWLTETYGYAHLEQRNYDTETMEANARSLVISRLYPQLEAEWRAMHSDDERAVHFLALEQGEAAEQLLKGMLSLYREIVVIEAGQRVLDANITAFARYKEDRACATHDVAVVKSCVAVMVEKDWPVAAKLAGQRVWALGFDNHAAMEYFVDRLRWPIEIGGRLFPQRVQGRRVGVTVLERCAGQLRVFDRRRTIPHDYTLRQLPSVGERWYFAQCAGPVTGRGCLVPALQTYTSAQCGLLGSDPLATLHAVARKNAGRLASHLLPVQTAWLGPTVLLFDARQHSDTPPVPTTLKRKAAVEDDDDVHIIQVTPQVPTKKQKCDPEDRGTVTRFTQYGVATVEKRRKSKEESRPLVQARLTGFTSYVKPTEVNK